MKRTASVVELKAKLSEHLRQVKSGHELIVTERGIPVAAIIVEKSIAGPSRRPATKKSLVLRTRRPIATPTAIWARQKIVSSVRWVIERPC